MIVLDDDPATIVWNRSTSRDNQAEDSIALALSYFENQWEGKRVPEVKEVLS